MKNVNALPVFGCAYKEFLSHRSILSTSKKLNRLIKIDKSSGIHKRGEATGQNTVPKIGETDRWIQGVPAYQRWYSWAENAKGSSTTAGEHKLYCWRLSVENWEWKTLGELMIGGSSPLCEFYFQELSQVLTVNTTEKFPQASSGACVVGKESFWNMP